MSTLPEDPVHHDVRSTFGACNQEDESPFLPAIVKGYSISPGGTGQKLPSTMLQKVNSGQVLGVLASIQPSDSTSVQTENTGAPIIFAHLHLEFRFCVGKCKLRVAETLTSPECFSSRRVSHNRSGPLSPLPVLSQWLKDLASRER